MIYGFLVQNENQIKFGPFSKKKKKNNFKKNAAIKRKKIMLCYINMSEISSIHQIGRPKILFIRMRNVVIEQPNLTWMHFVWVTNCMIKASN